MFNIKTYVNIGGKKYFVETFKNTIKLDLSDKQITDLKEIDGLNQLTDLNIS